MVEVNSETDFVARNEQFQGLVRMIAKVALDAGADVEQIKAAKVGQRARSPMRSPTPSPTIGENMTLRRAAVAVGRQGRRSASYVHNSVTDGLGKIGVLVGAGIRPARPTSLPTSAARSPCMSPRPIRWRSIRPASIPAWSRARRTCSPRSTRQQGKPAQCHRKDRRVRPQDYYKEVCLLDQPSSMTPTKTVAQAVKEAEGKVGAPSRSRASCATRSAKASRSRRPISPPKWRPRPAKAESLLSGDGQRRLRTPSRTTAASRQAQV